MWHAWKTRARVGLLCALTLFVVLPAAAQAATTRYLSASGTDSGACTSTVSACRSFSYAYRQSGAGDIVQVAAGSYGAQDIPIVAGRSGAPVEFRPVPGARPILDGLDI